MAFSAVSAAPLRLVTNIGRMPPRPALLVLNQYYAPGQESTAQLLADLCEALAEDYDVTVVTGTVHDAPRAERTSRNGVNVIRVGSTAFDRSRLALRGFNYVSFVVLALVAALRRPRPQVVLCLSDPPFVSVIGVIVARRHRVPLVVVTQDVFPEIAVALGRLDNPVIVGVLDRLVRFGLRHATRVVAIGEHMRRRLVVKGVREDRISVIPNWTDTEALAPRERTNEWAREHALTDRFVVMHSGNVGYAQDLPTLLHAASRLRDLDDVVVVVVGSGAMGAKLAELASEPRAGQRALPAIPTAGAPRGIAVERGCPRRRPRCWAGGVRCSEPALRNPRRGPTRDRSRRRGERDGGARFDAGSAVSSFRRGSRSYSRRRSAMRTPSGRNSSAWVAPPAHTQRPKPVATWRSGATAA